MIKRYCILIGCFWFIQKGMAQGQPVRVKQPAQLRSSRSFLAEVDSQLNKIVEKYVAQTNTEATWAKIKGEATDLLLTYFQSAKLLGAKSSQAFFVKMGNDTMTTTDIANHKMILMVGIAAIKPGEFEIIRVEKTSIAK